jgi:thioredoxin-like negative regulator of GroEL
VRPLYKAVTNIDKISKEKSEIVSIVSVDIDANEQIAKHFKVATLPALMLFKNSRQLSSHEGFLDEAGLVEWIKKFE